MQRIAASGVLLGLLVSFTGAVAPTQAAIARPIPVKADQTRQPEVRVWSNDFKVSRRFMALDVKATGGGNMASADLDGDGTDEIIVGSGLGAEPEVRIFGADGTLRKTFSPYLKGFKGGVRVAAGDVTGDDKVEIVTAPGPGTEANIRVFDINGVDLLTTKKVAYSPSFLGGVHLAVGDVLGDSKAEIITSPGPGGGPHVRVWSGGMENLGADFFAFPADMTDGVTVAIAKTIFGGAVVTAVESWSEPLVRLQTLRGGRAQIGEFYPFDRTSHRGVSISTMDLNGDGLDEIATVGNGGTVPEVAFFHINGTRLAMAMLHDPTYRGSLALAGIKTAGVAAEAIASLPMTPVITGPTEAERFIDVNLTEQRLYAYERGRIAKSFLISTGVPGHATPVGKTAVQKKIPIMDYRWSYGVNHPDNYNIKNVKFNLNIFPHIYIHTAYWHNNFGYRMSHGCVNMHVTDAEWVYNWASIGTTVETHY